MFTVVTLLASGGAHRKPAKYAKIGISYEMRRDVGMKKTTRDNGLVAIVPRVPLCDSYRIQTYNLLIRSQMLYSVELRSHVLGTNKNGCDSYRIQTYNLLIRSQMLYSVELRSQANRLPRGA